MWTFKALCSIPSVVSQPQQFVNESTSDMLFELHCTTVYCD